MSLAEIYARQYQWRRWSAIYPELDDLSGARLVDLGCGIGDQARDLSRLGAHVLGVDANQAFIDHANSRGIPRARFLCGNITDLRRHQPECDGVWASFSASFFPRFDAFLSSINPVLKPGGWLAMTEVDDLFGHEPLESRWKAIIEAYYAKSLEEGVYRFRSHDHVSEVLSEHGWQVEIDRNVEDGEFCFAGTASAEVLEAWNTRLGFMMPRFLERFGDQAAQFDTAFLQCLASEEHRSHSRVWFILARKPDDAARSAQR